MAKIHHTTLDEVIAHFTDWEDPRSPINRKHPLVSVVVIALMAVLAGAGGPTAIARWAKTKKEFLLRVLDLPAGIPGKDVFRRVLMLLEPAGFQACFCNGLAALRAKASAASGIDRRVALLPQQPAAGGEAFCPSGTRSLGDRERLPLELGLHVSGRRVADPGKERAGELRVAEPVFAVLAQATPRQGQHRDETPSVRLGRELHAASANGINALVAAGPETSGRQRRFGRTSGFPSESATGIVACIISVVGN